METRGKRKPAKRPHSKKWESFKVEGDKLERVRKICPKCGPGVYLGKHSDRESCGKCGYTMFTKKMQKPVTST